MGRSVRIVQYAVNGTGVGHLTRLVAISRWLRRYCAHAGVRAEIFFLTSSEADALLFHERFASFKLPSKTAVSDAGIDKRAWLALGKQWVWHSLGLLQPDLLVVDTFPLGSYGELLGALDLCRRKAFIYRPVKAAVSARPDFQAALQLYDALLVPDLREEAPAAVPAAVQDRLRYCGPVAVRERAELLPRGEARARLGIPGDRLAVYVSGGGGGDTSVAAQLSAAALALADDPSIQLIVAAGPLYRGPRLHGERITWWTEGGLAELMAGLDLAVCAAGYNTFFELMQAGVPAVFLPQEKAADDQAARAARAVAAGAGTLLPSADPAAIAAAVAALRRPDVRARASRAARALFPVNGARTVAAELLRLVLPAAEVDAAEDAVDDELLERARGLDLPVEDVLHCARLLSGPAAATGALEPALELIGFARAHDLPAALLLRLVEALSRRLPATPSAERAPAVAAVLEALARFADWPTALAFVQALPLGPAQRALDEAGTAPAFADRLTALLRDLHASGGTLHGGLVLLARQSDPAAAQAPDDEAGPAGDGA